MLPQEILSQSFKLPNGVVIKNRIAKAAMSEALGTIDNHVTGALAYLYAQWAKGGAGLCITGNIMIDKKALGEPNNVVLQDESDLRLLEHWAASGTQNGTHLWMQLNHPGKQAPRGLNRETVAPSAVSFGPAMARFFATPRALKENEIQQIIKRFGTAAAIAKKTGFTGVQIHGAHGYLVSQFLSPIHNQRTDQWGGTPQNRQRFALAVLNEIRDQVGPEFPIGIKLNSTDFQKGGFTEDESIDVIRSLGQNGIDLIEISGGTYESAAMIGKKRSNDRSTMREAYFLDFANKARKTTQTPIMLTGGFRNPVAMAQAIESGAIDFVGLARKMAIEPDLPSKLLAGQTSSQSLKPIVTGIKRIDAMGFMEIAWYTRQLRRISKGQRPKPNESGIQALALHLLSGGWKSLNTRLRAR